jgi:hypothetical protein
MLSIFYTRKGKYIPARCIQRRQLRTFTRNCYAYRTSILCANSGNRFLRPHCCWYLCWHGWTSRNSRLAMAFYRVRHSSLTRRPRNANNECSEGAATALVAIVGFFLLPNTPLTTPWLTPDEQQLAHARIERDRIGDSTEKVSTMEGLRQACQDKRTWLFCLMQNFHLSACSFNSFFPTSVMYPLNILNESALTLPPVLSKLSASTQP